MAVRNGISFGRWLWVMDSGGVVDRPLFAAHYARIRRAEEQGAQLAASIQSWSQRTNLRGEASVAGDRLSWTLRLRIDEPAPLETEWNFIFDEAVHNLRSALDNAAVALGHLSGITDPKVLNRIHFPISASIEAWANDRSRIKDLAPEYQAAIEAVQPFKRGTDPKELHRDLLLILRDLDNKDKHHLQAIAVVQPGTLEHDVVEFE
jgi:hypothetical protein